MDFDLMGRIESMLWTYCVFIRNVLLTNFHNIIYLLILFLYLFQLNNIFIITEEISQKSSALHSFEKLYGQAMQLQVQVIQQKSS